MSFQSLADAFAYVQSRDDLTTNEAFVLIAIANHAAKGKDQAYPSIAGLQKTTKLSRSSIQRALRSLEKKKAIESILAPSGHGVSTYRLLLPHVYQVDSTKTTPVTVTPHDARHASPKSTQVTVMPPQVTVTPQPGIQPGKKEKRSGSLDAINNHIPPEVLQYPLHPHKAVWFGLTPGSDLYNAVFPDPPQPPAALAPGSLKAEVLRTYMRLYRQKAS